MKGLIQHPFPMKYPTSCRVQALQDRLVTHHRIYLFPEVPPYPAKFTSLSLDANFF